MNIAVTVQTGPGEHLVRWSRPLKCFKTSVGLARVARKVVAITAKLGHPAGQEFVVIAAVGDMARQTILIYRGMGPHERASLLGMAPVTEFVDGIRLEQGGAKSSMGLVTFRAFQFSFPDGMMGSPVFLGPDAFVARITELRLGFL